jgi:hypothetical protein
MIIGEASVNKCLEIFSLHDNKTAMVGVVGNDGTQIFTKIIVMKP